MNKKLFREASAARRRAYARYSNFKVGVAILNASGGTHIGCNVENASYPEGWCAETSAIAAMVAANPPGKGRRIAEIAVVADTIDGRLTSPCGGCRQRLAEFGSADTLVHMHDPSGKRSATYKLADLLPAAFALEAKA
jgi:cytidine deaminase